MVSSLSARILHLKFDFVDPPFDAGEYEGVDSAAESDVFHGVTYAFHGCEVLAFVCGSRRLGDVFVV